jgi:hypothetical protein
LPFIIPAEASDEKIGAGSDRHKTAKATPANPVIIHLMKCILPDAETDRIHAQVN